VAAVGEAGGAAAGVGDDKPPARSNPHLTILDHDPIQLNRIMISSPCLSVISAQMPLAFVASLQAASDGSLLHILAFSEPSSRQKIDPRVIISVGAHDVEIRSSSGCRGRFL
jgi:hypothetical protein